MVSEKLPMTFRQSTNCCDDLSDNALELVFPDFDRAGKALHEVSPRAGEDIMNWIFDLVPQAPFAVKTPRPRLPANCT